MDVTDSTFDEQVLMRSRDLPVVVDFWAPWCGPCRQLGPLIESVAARYEDDLVLAKVDIDDNPEVAARFRIQSIPAIRAFRDGAIVAQFDGLVPADSIDAFFRAVVPSEADRLVAQGDEESLRDAVRQDPGRVDARVLLARILMTTGRADDAVPVLEPVSHDAEAQGILARLALAADDTPDVQAGIAALDRGDVEDGLSYLIDAIRGASGEAREALRQAIVGVFLELGDQDELTVKFRRRLAQTLY